MSRWGEEEKKTKGLWGCGFAFALLGLSIWVFLINYNNLESRRQLEADMQKIIRVGYDKTETQMVGEIMGAAEKLGVMLEPQQIELSKFMDDNNNPVVDVWIEFDFTVDLLVHQFEVSIPIAEKVTIVTF
jgi:hypothetical protein